jgi:hypothetical protein
MEACVVKPFPEIHKFGSLGLIKGVTSPHIWNITVAAKRAETEAGNEHSQ